MESFGGTESNWPAFKDVELDSRYQTFLIVELKFLLLLSVNLPFFWFCLFIANIFLFLSFYTAANKSPMSWSYKTLRSTVTRSNAHLKHVHFPGTCGNRIRQRARPSVVTHLRPQRWWHQALGKSSYHEWQFSVPAAGEKFIRVKMEFVILRTWLMISLKFLDKSFQLVQIVMGTVGRHWRWGTGYLFPGWVLPVDF